MDEGERPACDGLAEDGAGNIYFGSFEQRSLLRREPDGRYELLAHDDRFGWPDGLAYHDGWLYVTLGQWKRLPAFNETQKALQEFACLGNSAEIAALTAVHGTSEEELHSYLWEAVRLEFIVRLEDSYRFIHDRVQEAAYSLIPEPLRAESHLRIGRLLAARSRRPVCVLVSITLRSF